MSLLHSSIFGRLLRKYTKWAMLAVLVAAFPAMTFGATCRPLVVINRFVSPEELAKVQHIQVSGQPVIVLNPYVEPLKTAENGIIPYQRITPRPQIIYPAKLNTEHK